MHKAAYQIRISGKVQGVFFRASTKAKADDLGIHGIVRNEPDGSVHIEAEGGETLAAFISWCKKGPARAHVDTCEISELPAKGYQDFRIVR